LDLTNRIVLCIFIFTSYRRLPPPPRNPPPPRDIPPPPQLPRELPMLDIPRLLLERVLPPPQPLEPPLYPPRLDELGELRLPIRFEPLALFDVPPRLPDPPRFPAPPRLPELPRFPAPPRLFVLARLPPKSDRLLRLPTSRWADFWRLLSESPRVVPPNLSAVALSR